MVKSGKGVEGGRGGKERIKMGRVDCGCGVEGGRTRWWWREETEGGAGGV